MYVNNTKLRGYGGGSYYRSREGPGLGVVPDIVGGVVDFIGGIFGGKKSPEESARDFLNAVCREIAAAVSMRNTAEIERLLQSTAQRTQPAYLAQVGPVAAEMYVRARKCVEEAVGRVPANGGGLAPGPKPPAAPTDAAKLVPVAVAAAIALAVS